MNREHALKFLEIGRAPVLKAPNGTTITFVRRDESDIDRIEKLTDKNLMDEWKGSMCMIDLQQCFSIGDLQELQLLEMEINARDIDWEPLNDWFEKTKKEFEEEYAEGGNEP